MAESTSSIARAFRERPIATVLSTGFGVGLSPVAPGTAGSLLALGLAAGAVALLHRSQYTPGSMTVSLGLLMSGLAVCAIGVPLTTRASRAIGGKDPGVIVLDEISGQWIACSPVPLFAFTSPLRGALLWLVSFLAFRLFDVWKPGPIHRLQELPDGLGIMVDDVLAGALAAGVTLVAGKALAG